MELHERISMIRKAMGMTQEQMGQRIGVSGETIGSWESGQVVPDAQSIGKLCRELNLSADYVLLGKEPEERTEGAGRFRTTRKAPLRVRRIRCRTLVPAVDGLYLERFAMPADIRCRCIRPEEAAMRWSRPTMVREKSARGWKSWSSIAASPTRTRTRR